MNTNNLEEILKQLDVAEQTASIDPNEPQYARTRSGIENSVKQAKEKVQKLKEDYAKTVQQNGVAIFLNGPSDKVQAFAKLVNDLGEAVVVDAEELYAQRFLPVIEQSIGKSREWTSTQSAIMHRLLGEVGKELKVFLSRALRLPNTAALPTKQDTLNFIRNVMREELGDDYNAEYLKKSLAREGLKIRYMGVVAPVIVVNATPEETIGLGQMFGRGKATVTITDEDNVTEEFIKATFKHVQKQIKQNKNKQ
jgi:hypothetical protein